MSKFTNEELSKRKMIGLVAAGLCALTAIICHIALGRGAGVPEFLETARGVAWTGVVVAGIWTGLTVFIKEFVN
jgi:hypothetical protein